MKHRQTGEEESDEDKERDGRGGRREECRTYRCLNHHGSLVSHGSDYV